MMNKANKNWANFSSNTVFQKSKQLINKFGPIWLKENIFQFSTAQNDFENQNIEIFLIFEGLVGNFGNSEGEMI